MKKVLLTVSFVIAGIALFQGCELSTPPLGPPRGKVTGHDLVINEVFTIPPDRYYAYSWIELFNPTDRNIPWLDDIFPITSYALGSDGTLIRTENLDEGIWEVGITPMTGVYNSINFYYPDTAFACGNGGLLQKFKHDALANTFTVENLVSGTTRNINDVQFGYLSAIGYMVCDGGEIRRSLNRGATWTLQTSGTTTSTTKNLNHLTFVDFGSPPRIWTVGDSGIVLRKSSGITWAPQVVPVDKQTTNWYGMTMTTDTGFVVGEGGAVIFTRNGGTNWSSKPTPVTTTLRSVFMSEDPQSHKKGRAWVVGDNGTILRTNDYGTTWIVQNSGTTAKLNSVVFGDSIRGAVYGDGGTLLNTSDGGATWTAQNSRTSADLVAATMLPLTIKVENYYVLEMIAKRKTFFVDLSLQPPVINFNYFTKIDTGLIVYDPQTLFNLRLANLPKTVPPYSFIILNSDSVRFQDHMNLGPSEPQVLNLSIAFQPDSSFHPVLWDLLASGEVRLIKYYIKQTTGGQPIFLGFDRRVIEIVRYGDFVPTTAFYPPDELFPNNVPLGFLPEGYSIARYANDGGGKPADEQSTAYSFYMSSDPIPGWFSQESRP